MLYLYQEVDRGGGAGSHLLVSRVLHLQEDVLQLHVSVDDALSVAEVGADDDVLEEPPACSVNGKV